MTTIEDIKRILAECAADFEVEEDRGLDLDEPTPVEFCYNEEE